MDDFKKYASLAKKGDTAAFAELYSLVYKDMYYIALYSLRNSHGRCKYVVCCFCRLRSRNAFGY